MLENTIFFYILLKTNAKNVVCLDLFVQSLLENLEDLKDIKGKSMFITLNGQLFVKRR